MPATHWSDVQPSMSMSDADTANGERTMMEAAGPCVLVAVDESAGALRAARCARRLFVRDAHYVVMNVGAREIDPFGAGPMALGGVYPLAAPYLEVPRRQDDDRPSDVDVAQAEAEKVADRAGMPDGTTPLGAVGDPVDQILEAARIESADVIVIGSGEGSWWQRLFDPPVSKSILRNAETPVLVVP